MAGLLIHVEGETEETFVNEVLGLHLYARGYSRVSARLMGNARQRDRRGGIRPWSRVKQDIVTHLAESLGVLGDRPFLFLERNPRGFRGRQNQRQS